MTSADDAGKWNFTDDLARKDAIIEEASERRQEAEAIANAQKPVWHWAVFWMCLFGFLSIVIYLGKWP